MRYKKVEAIFDRKKWRTRASYLREGRENVNKRVHIEFCEIFCGTCIQQFYPPSCSINSWFHGSRLGRFSILVTQSWRINSPWQQWCEVGPQCYKCGASPRAQIWQSWGITQSRKITIMRNIYCTVFITNFPELVRYQAHPPKTDSHCKKAGSQNLNE